MKIEINKVKTLRFNKGWSQEQLSETSGLSLRTIQRIENENTISMESLKVLAKALDVDTNELLIKEKQNPTTPIEAIKICFMEYANFTGKASRYEYWWFLLFMILVMSIAYLIHERLNQIITIIFLVPFLAVGARRLNDAGQSIWWQLFLFVPFGQIIVLFMMAEKTKYSEDLK
ncbi:MAG TPA: DUF805 domain-containing protein [Erysipelotrichaceae bacterium]|nr:DUF805 domain-containing protein [Erysipelotrichaceae bacterium]